MPADHEPRSARAVSLDARYPQNSKDILSRSFDDNCWSDAGAIQSLLKRAPQPCLAGLTGLLFWRWQPHIVQPNTDETAGRLLRLANRRRISADRARRGQLGD